MKRRPILKDVAALANLSVSAVSLALRNPSALPEETVKRVKQAAEELGYTPDPGLSALAAYRRRTRVQQDFGVIALVSKWSSPDEWMQRDSAQSLLEGATERARTLGYSLQHLWAGEEGMSPKRFSSILVNRGIRGLVLAPFSDPSERFDLQWESFSVVTIERPVHYSNFHYVVPNYYMDMMLVWEKLQAFGYRRIGLVLDDELAERVAHQWEAAHIYEQSRQLSDNERVPTLLLEGGRTKDALKAWIDKYRPDAVISRSENNICRIMRSMNLHIPDDIGYVTLNRVDDVEGASGIYQRRDVMGATAVDILNGLLLVGTRGPGDVSVGTQVAGVWEDGCTLGRRRQ